MKCCSDPSCSNVGQRYSPGKSLSTGQYYGNQLAGSICWIEIYPMDNAIQRLNNQGQIRNPEGKLIHYMYGRVENRKWQPLQMHKRFIRYFQNYMQESPRGIVLELSKLGLLSVNYCNSLHMTFMSGGSHVKPLLFIQCFVKKVLSIIRQIQQQNVNIS